MAFFFAGLVILGVLLLLARAFVAADPRTVVRTLRYLVGGGLLFFGFIFFLAERWGLALPLAAAGISALSLGRIGPIDLGGGKRSAGSRSTVRSRYIEMTLDHDTGEMVGTVQAGTFTGRGLDDLDEASLRLLYAEVSGDAKSVSLLEAYLDRRKPGWREDVEGDRDAGPRRPADAGAMTDEEAYKVLGLAPGAGEAEIRAAHRRLMLGVHPDQGGSTFLAAKINEAKDRLLGLHR
jgi:DnaJ domain